MPNPKGITERVFHSPWKYIQGPSAFKNADKHLASLGKAPLLLADDVVYEIAGKDLVAALSRDFTVTRATFNGEASRDEIARLSAFGAAHAIDFVIALGGGKTIDTAKAVADDLHVAVAVLPTTASTDAPCSAISVLYTPGGTFERARFFASNPAVVLVDTHIIAHAPARFLASGIGDALATNVEARAIRNTPSFGGGLPTQVAAAISQRCEEILFQYGVQAVEANRRHAITPALEAVVEANTLLSGLGFESGGVAAAHAIHDGLTAVNNPTLHTKLHGEKVAFGVICQLILDGASTSEIDRYIGLMHSVGLPITFADLGIPKPTEEELRLIAKVACLPHETIWALDIPISEDIVYNTIKGADAAGCDYLRRRRDHSKLKLGLKASAETSAI